MNDIHAMRTFIMAHRTSTDPFDIVMVGEAPREDDAQTHHWYQTHVEAGVTWWMETIGPLEGGVEAIRRRIALGPPEHR